MSESKIEEKSPLVSLALIATAVGFGLVALVIVWVHLTIPLSSVIVTDPREIFTTIGSALTGPIGGLIVGILAGILEPDGIWIASVFAHVVGGLWMGIAYKKLVYERFGETAMHFISWAVTIVVYYAVFVVPGFILGIRFFHPEIYQSPDVFGDLSVIDAYIALMPGLVPEILLTMVVTTVAMIALPKRYRKPLW